MLRRYSESVGEAMYGAQPSGNGQFATARFSGFGVRADDGGCVRVNNDQPYAEALAPPVFGMSPPGEIRDARAVMANPPATTPAIRIGNPIELKVFRGEAGSELIWAANEGKGAGVAAR